MSNPKLPPLSESTEKVLHFVQMFQQYFEAMTETEHATVLSILNGLQAKRAVELRQQREGEQMQKQEEILNAALDEQRRRSGNAVEIVPAGVIKQ